MSPQHEQTFSETLRRWVKARLSVCALGDLEEIFRGFF